MAPPHPPGGLTPLIVGHCTQLRPMGADWPRPSLIVTGNLLRQEKLAKGGSAVGSITETFRWNPVGNQSHPEELTGSRKRVLRGSGATPAANRRQLVPRPCAPAS